MFKNTNWISLETQTAPSTTGINNKPAEPPGHLALPQQWLGTFTNAPLPPTTSLSVNPAPPVESPVGLNPPLPEGTPPLAPEEPPPLPDDNQKPPPPPIDDEAGNMVVNSNEEFNKLTSLQQQAQSWQQQLWRTPQANPYYNTPYMNMYPAPQPYQYQTHPYGFAQPMYPPSQMNAYGQVPVGYPQQVGMVPYQQTPMAGYTQTPAAPNYPHTQAGTFPTLAHNMPQPVRYPTPPTSTYPQPTTANYPNPPRTSHEGLTSDTQSTSSTATVANLGHVKPTVTTTTAASTTTSTTTSTTSTPRDTTQPASSTHHVVKTQLATLPTNTEAFNSLLKDVLRSQNLLKTPNSEVSHAASSHKEDPTVSVKEGPHVPSATSSATSTTSSTATSTNPSTVTSTATSTASPVTSCAAHTPTGPEYDAILKEEAEFTKQYSDWKKQYSDWKQQNKDHPDKTLFAQYERQWKTYEDQMENRRYDILERKRSIIGTQARSVEEVSGDQNIPGETTQGGHINPGYGGYDQLPQYSAPTTHGYSSPGTMIQRPDSTRMSGPQSRMSGPYHRMAAVSSRMSGPDYSMPSPQSGMHGSQSRMPGPDSRMPTPQSRNPGPDSRMPTPQSRNPGPDSRMPTPQSRMPGPDSRMPTLHSRMAGPDSRMLAPQSRMLGPDHRMLTPQSRMPGPNFGMSTQQSRMLGPDSTMPTPWSRMPGSDSRMPTPQSRMPGPDSRMPTPQSRMPRPDSRMPTPQSRMPGSDFRMPSPQSKMPGPDSRMPAAQSRLPGPNSTMPTTPSKMPTAQHRMPGPASRMPTPQSRMPGSDSRMPGPQSIKPGIDFRMPGSQSRMPATDFRMSGPDQRMPAADSRKPGPDARMSESDYKMLGSDSNMPGSDSIMPESESKMPGSSDDFGSKIKDADVSLQNKATNDSRETSDYQRPCDTVRPRLMDVPQNARFAENTGGQYHDYGPRIPGQGPRFGSGPRMSTPEVNNPIYRPKRAADDWTVHPSDSVTGSSTSVTTSNTNELFDDDVNQEYDDQNDDFNDYSNDYTDFSNDESSIQGALRGRGHARRGTFSSFEDGMNNRGRGFSRGRRGFMGNGARGGFTEGVGGGEGIANQGGGGFSDGVGRGDSMTYRGRGGYTEGVGRGDSMANRGRGGYTEGVGRGDSMPNKGRGGYTEGVGRGDSMANRGRGGYTEGVGRGDSMANRGRGGYTEGVGRGDSMPNRGRGGYTEGVGRGDSMPNRGRGGFSGGVGRDASMSNRGRGGFSEGMGRGDSFVNRGRGGSSNSVGSAESFGNRSQHGIGRGQPGSSGCLDNLEVKDGRDIPPAQEGRSIFSTAPRSIGPRQGQPQPAARLSLMDVVIDERVQKKFQNSEKTIPSLMDQPISQPSSLGRSSSMDDMSVNATNRETNNPPHSAMTPTTSHTTSVPPTSVSLSPAELKKILSSVGAIAPAVSSVNSKSPNHSDLSSGSLKTSVADISLTSERDNLTGEKLGEDMSSLDSSQVTFDDCPFVIPEEPDDIHTEDTSHAAPSHASNSEFPTTTESLDSDSSLQTVPEQLPVKPLSDNIDEVPEFPFDPDAYVAPCDRKLAQEGPDDWREFMIPEDSPFGDSSEDILQRTLRATNKHIRDEIEYTMRSSESVNVGPRIQDESQDMDLHGGYPGYDYYDPIRPRYPGVDYTNPAMDRAYDDYDEVLAKRQRLLARAQLAGGEDEALEVEQYDYGHKSTDSVNNSNTNQSARAGDDDDDDVTEAQVIDYSHGGSMLEPKSSLNSTEIYRQEHMENYKRSEWEHSPDSRSIHDTKTNIRGNYSYEGARYSPVKLIDQRLKMLDVLLRTQNVLAKDDRTVVRGSHPMTDDMRSVVERESPSSTQPSEDRRFVESRKHRHEREGYYDLSSDSRYPPGGYKTHGGRDDHRGHDDRRGQVDPDWQGANKPTYAFAAYEPKNNSRDRSVPAKCPPEKPRMGGRHVNVSELLQKPGRLNRPRKILIILRGAPGSGKTYLAKLIREVEVENGGNAPRMLCLDDYFMVEVEKTVKDEETGKMVTVKCMEHEYEPGVEEAYRASMIKAFKKTIDNGFFSFIIYDAVNEKIKHFSPIVDYAKKNGFYVYVAVTTADVAVCSARNTHKRSREEIQKIVESWEPTPNHYSKLDCRSILQDAAIPEVEMEDEMEDAKESEDKKDTVENKASEDNSEEDDTKNEWVELSKWELDTSGDKLDKLDGLRSGKRKRTPSPQNLEEYLQLDELSRKEAVPGKKRVRWVDIEERQLQLKQREIGFVVGQTAHDWKRMTDDTYAEKALNRTKYI